jgi:hypothetical protein
VRRENSLNKISAGGLKTAALMAWRFLFFREFLMPETGGNIMNSPKIVLRINAANPDHHLWNNNGTWWCHYTVHPTPFTKQRIRASLGTKSLIQARSRRDQLFSAK